MSTKTMGAETMGTETMGAETMRPGAYGARRILYS